MPHPLIRRAGTFALLAALCVPQAGALSGVSAWAQESVAAAQQAGLVPDTLEQLSAQDEITRAEFCGIAVNTYKALSGKAVFASGKQPFRDCDDPSVAAAYELGLVNGRGNGRFDPDASIARQDLCVMLSNILEAADVEAPEIVGEACIEDYADAPLINDYAREAVVTMVDYTIVNGLSVNGGEDTILAPNGTTTREQALVMATRFCNAFADLSDEGDSDSTVLPEVPGASDLWTDPDTILPMTEEEKMALVYGPGGEKYQTAEEAEANMVEISVPVWRLQADGTKTSGTAS